MAVRENYNLLQDRTATINKIENEYGLFTQLGIFGEEGITTRTFQYDQYEDGFGLVEDRAWGSKRDQFAGKEVLETYAFPIPHFPFDGHIKPSDIQSRRAPGTDSDFDTVSAAVARELARIRKSWAQTKEWAHREAIVNGVVYAPNGTVAVDYYASLGVTRKEVDYLLGTPTTEVQEKSEEVIGHCQDNLQDGSLVTEFIGVASPEFFSKLVRHAKYEEAYKYWNASNANGALLRDRLPTLPNGMRTFLDGAGVLWIEYRASVKGTSMIPANEAYVLPLDTDGDTFKTVYAPADHMDYTNTEGMSAYAWTYELERGRGIDVETESNFADFIFKPQCVVKCTTSN